jgi:hypothetical protein
MKKKLWSKLFLSFGMKPSVTCFQGNGLDQADFEAFFCGRFLWVRVELAWQRISKEEDKRALDEPRAAE